VKGIKLNGTFLDIKPGTATEINRKSPFFAISDYSGEVTTVPIVFPYTPNNALAMGLPYQYFTKRKKTKFDVEHYSDNEYRGRASLIIETGLLNLNNIEETEINGYLVYGLSHFFQDLKGKKLEDLKLGGKRTFTYTTNNPDDGSDGYWQHFHDTWTDPDIPYVFYPIRNEEYYGETGNVDWINVLNNEAKLRFDFDFPIVPMIKLKYLLEQIMNENGYQVDFTGLADADWEKLTLVNLTKLEWVTVGPVAGPSGNVTYNRGPAASVTIDLKKHVPQDKMITDFILQLFKRFGWAPLFDPLRKTCKYVAVKQADKGTVKDWTEFAIPEAPTNFNEEKPIFGFANEIDSNDNFPAAPTFDNLRFGLPAVYARFLSPPSTADEGMIRFCYHDNQWWQVQLNETTNLYEWVIFADNIYNEEPKSATETISTTISTLPVYDSEYREEAGITFNGLFPIMKHEARLNIGYRLLFYHGLVNELEWNGSTSTSPKQYPFASSTRETPNSINPLTWSNVYKQKNFGNTIAEVDYGIIKYWWSEFLQILQNGEEIDFTLWLPLRELTNFVWDDKILIKNIPYLVKEITEPDPYPGYVLATLKRLVKPEPEKITDNNGNEVEGVYAKMIITKVREEIIGGIFKWVIEYSKITILLFSNSAGTTPYTPTTPVYVYVMKDVVNNSGGGEPTHIEHRYFPVNNASEIILPEVFTVAYPEGNPSQFLAKHTYSLDPSGAYGYQVI
jgi:hypothetical protein